MDTCWEKNKNMDRFVRSALLLGLLALSFSSSLCGVNLQLERSVKITSVSETSASLQIGFSWDRSWCDSYNSDAVWIFFKWRTSRGEWSHVYLNTSASTPSGYTSFPGTSGNKTVGFFIYHSEVGLFPSATASLSVTWPFPSGITKEMFERGEVDIVAYGVEMVLVPFGSFLAGDGVSDRGFTAPGSSAALPITSEGALSVSTSGGALASASSGGSSLSGSGSSLASGEPISLYGSYPKGFNGFYCMKYELSQGQYTDFLNALSRAEQIRLLGDWVVSLQRGSFLFGGGASASFRNSIRVLEPASSSRGVVFASGGGLYASGGSPVACNFLSPADLLAYASWSGLRPMSELEFEKLCRRSSPLTALPGGFAWDSDSYTPMSGLLDIDTDSERPVSGNVNCAGGSPVRCGAFASSGTDRFSSGSSFSGVMELSGNVREMCVGVDASSFSRSVHGDGTYPLLPFGGSVNYSHIGTRGGGFSSPSDRLRVSDRADMYNTFSSSDSRLSDVGFRLVRSVDPSFVSVDAGRIGFGTGGATDTAYCSGGAFTISSISPASVSGIGGIDMSYEWYMDGGRVTGASGASLSFPSGLVNVPVSSGKRYRFTRRVVTALGSSESDPVTVLVHGKLTLVVSPDSLSVTSPSSPSFTASSLADGQVGWYLRSSDQASDRLLSGPSVISAESPVSYTPVYEDFHNTPGSYGLIVRGLSTSGCSDSVLLGVSVRFSIIGGLLGCSDSVCQGDPFVIRSKEDASFSGLPGLLPSYSWYMDGVLLSDSGSHGSSLSVSSSLSGGKAWSFFRRAFSSDGSYSDSDTVVVYVKRCVPLRSDGKPYRTVMVGDAEWFSENLELPSLSGVNWTNGSYGRLYNWAAALSSCPSGWHLPSDEEWDIWAASYSSSGLGTKMKAGGAGWSNASNESGFGALPGKGCMASGATDNSITGLYASFWSSTQTGSNPRIRRLLDSSSALTSTTRGSGYGQSVRCVRD